MCSLNICVGFPLVVNDHTFVTSALAFKYSMTTMHAYQTQLRSPLISTPNQLQQQPAQKYLCLLCTYAHLSSSLSQKNNYFFTLEMIVSSPIYTSLSYLWHFRVDPCCCIKIHILVPFFHYVWSRPTCNLSTQGFNLSNRGFLETHSFILGIS